MPRSSVQAPLSVVMIRPHHFTLNTLTARDNHFQTDGGADSEIIDRTAMDEVARAAEALENAGVRVHLCADEGAATPDSVFPNNWFAPRSGGHVAIYPMYAPHRRAERRQDVLEMLKHICCDQDIIDLTYVQISAFSGNATKLQGKDGLVLALSSRALAALSSEQKRVLERHVALLPLEIPTIELAGGSVRCTIAGLHLSRRSDAKMSEVAA